MGLKVEVLVMRITKPIHGTGRAVILDSGFGYIPTEVGLAQKGCTPLWR